jgi:hypothetical protein
MEIVEVAWTRLSLEGVVKLLPRQFYRAVPRGTKTFVERVFGTNNQLAVSADEKSSGPSKAAN